MAKFCSNCGTALNEGARFCHVCGVAADSAAAPATSTQSKSLFWVPTIIAIVAVTALVTVQFSSRDVPQSDTTVMSPSRVAAPDISTMSAEEQSSRLFDRVMRLSSEGKNDSAAFFAPMALGAIEAAGPMDNHRRYDMGMVGLVTGNTAMAAAQADSILASRPTHLLGLALAARVADAKKDAAAAASFRKKLLAAEAGERAANLPEYSMHDNDVTEALRRARK